MKKNFLLVPAIRDILHSENFSSKIREGFADTHPREISSTFEELTVSERAKAIFSFPLTEAITIFEYFEDRQKRDIFLHINKKQQVLVISHMSHDERIDLFKILPLHLQNAILKDIDQDNKDNIKLLSSYQEGSVGSIITTECAYVSEKDTSKKALRSLRQHSVKTEIIYYIYVVNSDQKLLGLVSLRQLIMAKPEISVKDIMQTEIIKVHVDDEQSKAASIIKNYDFLALPAIDDKGHLIGIVTVDDVVDLVVEEEREKILSLAAVGKHSPYLSASFFTLVRSRLLWLFILIGVGFVSGYVLEIYQSVLDNVLSLIFFIPLLCASAGNAGTQSATVVIRELSTERIDSRDFWNVLKKELFIGLSLGCLLGSLCLLKALFCDVSFEMGLKLGVTVAMSMVVVLSIATSCGAIFPIVLKRMGVDPAIVSAPLIASVVDVCSLFTYMELAKFFFSL